MVNTETFQKEWQKLAKLFEKVEPDKRELVDGLLDQAAFLRAENDQLQQIIEEYGALSINPVRPTMQRPTEAVKMYLKNANIYNSVIRTLGMILQKNLLEEDDDFEQFLKEQREMYGDG